MISLYLLVVGGLLRPPIVPLPACVSWRLIEDRFAIYGEGLDADTRFAYVVPRLNAEPARTTPLELFEMLAQSQALALIV
jgi:hypothetical protein